MDGCCSLLSLGRKSPSQESALLEASGQLKQDVHWQSQKVGCSRLGVLVFMSNLSNQRNKVSVVTFFFFCFSLFLTAYSSKHPAVGRAASGLVGTLVSPLQSGVSLVLGWAFGLVDEYVFLVGLKQQNAELTSRLEAVDMMATEVKELRRENEDLRRLLKMLERPSLEGIVSSIIGASSSRWIEGITIDRGESDGVRVGMPVISEQGVVGQVVVTSRRSARVLLLTDRVSGIDSIIQSSRIRGVVEGVGERRCQLRYVGIRDHVSIGDRVVTSGLDGVFPRGLLVGIVAAIRSGEQGIFQRIDVEPAVVPNSLERVVVLNKFPPDLEDKLEEPMEVGTDSSLESIAAGGDNSQSAGGIESEVDVKRDDAAEPGPSVDAAVTRSSNGDGVMAVKQPLPQAGAAESKKKTVKSQRNTDRSRQ